MKLVPEVRSSARAQYGVVPLSAAGEPDVAHRDHGTALNRTGPLNGSPVALAAEGLPAVCAHIECACFETVELAQIDTVRRDTRARWYSGRSSSMFYHRRSCRRRQRPRDSKRFCLHQLPRQRPSHRPSTRRAAQKLPPTLSHRQLKWRDSFHNSQYHHLQHEQCTTGSTQRNQDSHSCHARARPVQQEQRSHRYDAKPVISASALISGAPDGGLMRSWTAVSSIPWAITVIVILLVVLWSHVVRFVLPYNVAPVPYMRRFRI